MIVLHPYNRDWPVEFAAIRARLVDALGTRARHIAHIGSTAVPGLAAKDIIDIQVAVQALGPDLVAALGASGFEHVPKHPVDHTPPGADDPADQWRKLYFRSVPPERPCHVHVRVLGNANQRYALLFRDYLRQHPGSRMTIEVIKRELARLHGNDADAYYAVKDPVYDLIWQAAQAWAQRCGWRHDAASEA